MQGSELGLLQRKPRKKKVSFCCAAVVVIAWHML